MSEDLEDFITTMMQLIERARGLQMTEDEFVNFCRGAWEVNQHELKIVDLKYLMKNDPDLFKFTDQK